ncbi:MAG TPA: ATP-binding protein [Candidatus Udaeobacter sp.]|jgi:PAS domain S-box-containing protein|nr:ATP-binding protein [Candidatus Udaeobacter sp.]
MRIHTKLLVPGVVLLALILGAVVYLFSETRETKTALDASSTKIRRINALSRGLNELTEKITREILLYRFDQNPVRLETMAESQAQIENVLKQFGQLEISPHALKLLDRYADGRAEDTRLRLGLLAAIKTEDQEKLDSALNRWTLNAQRDGAVLDDLLTFLTNEVEWTVAKVNEDWLATQSFAVSFLILISALVGASSLYYIRIVSRPLRRLAHSAAEIARGSTRAEIPAFNGDDEIGRLAYAFKEMTESLIEANANLEQKVAERTAELAALAGIVESSNDAIIGETREGLITSWNKAAERIYGYAAREVIGRPISMLLPPEQAHKSLQNLQRVVGGDVVEHHETVRLKKDATRIHVSLTLSPIKDASGSIVGVSAVARDITERKRGQDQLQLHLKRISALQEINLAITSTLDLQAVLQVLMEKINLFLPYAAVQVWLLNQATNQLERAACWNLDEKDWKGRSLPSTPKLVREAMESKKPVVALDVQTDPRTLDPDFYKRNSLISYLGVPLLAKEKALGVLVFLTREKHQYEKDEIDFLSSLASQAAIAIHNSQLHQKTQRQALELEQASQLQADFTAMIAHDLRSPLFTIIGVTEVMNDGAVGEISKDQKKWMDRIRNNASSLVNLVSDFLDISKLEAGHINLCPKSIDLQDLIQSVMADYEPLAKSKNITLGSQLDTSLPPVYADGRRLNQVLNNLLSNALKFSQDGGAIEIRVGRENGSGVIVQVKDGGVGIPRDEIPNLFQKYRQASSATVSTQKGTGLGLVICKMIIEAHGGRMWVASEEGKGSTFTFTLPFGQRLAQTDNPAFQTANA